MEGLAGCFVGGRLSQPVEGQPVGVCGEGSEWSAARVLSHVADDADWADSSSSGERESSHPMLVASPADSVVKGLTPSWPGRRVLLVRIPD